MRLSHIEYPPLLIPVLFRHCIRVDFPLLEELDTLRFLVSADTKGDLEGFAHKAPKLHKMRVGCLPVAGDSFDFAGFPFSQLSHFEYRDPTHWGIEKLFDNSPNLVSLKINDRYGFFPIGARSQEHITCPSIKTLTLCRGRVTRNYDPTVLSYLSLPSLQNLHFAPSNLTGSWAHFGPFMAFLSRSSPPLTTLMIQSLNLSDSNLIRILAQIPTLLDLVIDDNNVPPAESPITYKFIESFHASRTTGQRPIHIVPRLRSLKLDVGADAFEDALIVDMVQSRWITEKLSASYVSGSQSDGLPAVDCLREFTMRFRRRKEVKGVFQPIEDTGMRVVVLWMEQ
ncbi:hypothetical protein BT96DRAFT_1013511 [Gymnopus androsaceus JB14]|uniref:F-box domain-containing protein n=1 Tax=Gymnopus androsaceus JB14 TaxID=1447944 RepID=A0A6A4ICY4_9AGAR|nr:hypothetical protein BT96DRAFT_1013511 [Gymnopus androsaceus JB14]